VHPVVNFVQVRPRFKNGVGDVVTTA